MWDGATVWRLSSLLARTDSTECARTSIQSKLGLASKGTHPERMLELGDCLLDSAVDSAELVPRQSLESSAFKARTAKPCDERMKAAKVPRNCRACVAFVATGYSASETRGPLSCDGC